MAGVTAVVVHQFCGGDPVDDGKPLVAKFEIALVEGTPRFLLINMEDPLLTGDAVTIDCKEDCVRLSSTAPTLLTAN